jgi:hypothetical protein
MTVSTFGKTKLSHGIKTMDFYATLYQKLQKYRYHKHQYEKKIELLTYMINHNLKEPS